MISTKGTQEGKSMFPQRLDPGIHDVKITSITAGKSTVKLTPYVEFTFENAFGNHRETFYMKQGDSITISLEKIKHLATKIVSEADLDTVQGKDETEYAAKLAALLVGKEVRIKLSGKEQWNAKLGKAFVERNFGFYPFAESMNTPKANTMLRYNPNNAGDFKRLQSSAGATSDPMDMEMAEPADKGDLPF